jgi:RNA polymerase sigma-70 factor, ECF subfamily
MDRPAPSLSSAEYARRLEELSGSAAGYARSILRNREDARDAVQDAALRGLQGLGTYNPLRSFKAWWFAIVRHCCIDAIRSKPVRTVGLEAADAPAAPGPPVDDWEELAAALERIGPEHAEILRLRYFAGLSYRELADTLDIPAGTVMSRLHHARRRLANEMEERR